MSDVVHTFAIHTCTSVSVIYMYMLVVKYIYMKAMYACSITVGESVSVRFLSVLFVWCVWYVCSRYGFHLLQCTESCEASGGLVGG